MPLIEFHCASCGERMEKILPFSAVTDDLTTTCVSCGANAPRILFSRTLEPMFYGNPEGYGKPSATKRYSTKLVAQKGNDAAAG